MYDVFKIIIKKGWKLFAACGSCTASSLFCDIGRSSLIPPKPLFAFLNEPTNECTLDNISRLFGG